MTARKKSATKKRGRTAAPEKEVEFRGGQLTILNPELEEKMRKWWEESKRDTYAWAQIVLKPRTGTKRDRKKQLERARLDANPSSFSGRQVQFRKGRLIFVDEGLRQQIEEWWQQADRGSNDWAKVTMRPEHASETHGPGAFEQISHKAGHMDSNCIG